MVAAGISRRQPSSRNGAPRTMWWPQTNSAGAPESLPTFSSNSSVGLPGERRIWRSSRRPVAPGRLHQPIDTACQVDQLIDIRPFLRQDGNAQPVVFQGDEAMPAELPDG